MLLYVGMLDKPRFTNLGIVCFSLKGRPLYRQHPTLNKRLMHKPFAGAVGWLSKLIISQILYLPSQLLQPQYGLIDHMYYTQKICKNELLEEWIVLVDIGHYRASGWWLRW